MFGETVKFNISILETRYRPNGKPTDFPVITYRYKSVEILAVGIAAGGTKKGSPVCSHSR